MNKLIQYFQNVEDTLWKSNRKHLGVSTGDDRNLMVIREPDYTCVYWKANNGLETTIFEGYVKDENLDTLFEWLEIESYGLWRE